MTIMCEDSFNRLAIDDPARLLDLARGHITAAHDLTYIAEALGRIPPGPHSAAMVRALVALSHHADPVVREGACYGMAPHTVVDVIRERLRDMAVNDVSPGVQVAAAEALE